MKYILVGSILLVLLIVIFTGSAGTTETKTNQSGMNFNSYWYNGEAELTRYELKQVRYGDIYEGDAVLIFVTEDFLPEKQVKFEYGPVTEAPIKVLKLNFTKKFYTGVYPYSIMSSVFTPINTNKTLKVTTTVQEWCGHTFMQLNARGNEYTGSLYSYFQKEGDQTFSLKNVLLEDEVWTRIRLNPATLPTGTIDIIPASEFQRLTHIKPQVTAAEAELNSVSDGVSEYHLTYNNFKRSLNIRFESQFPHRILEWEESHQPVSGQDKMLITTAKRTHSIMLDYWNRNDVEDRILLPELGLN
jgi:hypothetical protein